MQQFATQLVLYCASSVDGRINMLASEKHDVNLWSIGVMFIAKTIIVLLSLYILIAQP